MSSGPTPSWADHIDTADVQAVDAAANLPRVLPDQGDEPQAHGLDGAAEAQASADLLDSWA